MIFSRLKHPLLIHLVGGITLAVFLGWFVLPSCHCQWDLIFGNTSGQTQDSELNPGLDGNKPLEPPCHCDDCPGKTFEFVDVNEDHTSSKPVNFLAASLPSPFHQADFKHDSLGRGPPPESFQAHHPEPRTYLRHLSLLL